jgi:hypothetical protein
VQKLKAIDDRFWKVNYQLDKERDQREKVRAVNPFFGRVTTAPGRCCRLRARALSVMCR